MRDWTQAAIWLDFSPELPSTYPNIGSLEVALRKSALLVVISLAAASPILIAQNPQSPQRHAPDAGTIERVVGPLIPTIPGAPFSAYVVTEWTHLLPDGTVGTVKNRRLIARDSAGHVYEEHRDMTPDGDQRPTRLTWTNYADPQRHEYYACVPGNHLCEVAPLRQAALPVVIPARAQQNVTTPSGPEQSSTVARAQPGSANGVAPHAPAMQIELLGERVMDNINVNGSREITTFPQGAFGNQAPEPVIKEFWYSDRLQVNILTKRFDPRISASQTFTLTNINLFEPDPRLFLVPEYQIIQVPTPNAAALSASVMTPMPPVPQPSANQPTR
jgi:hypothetical protein